MAVVQNLYQIYKIPCSFLVANNCKIENYTISQGFKDENIVSIGDNIVFQQLRYLHGDFRDHKKLFNQVQKLRKNEHEYKKAGRYKEASILNRYITNLLFVKDIVNIVVDKKKSDFNKFRTKGFNFNGIHYVYLCSGSGQIRRNTATFVNEQYHDQLVKNINCGLDKKTNQFVLAKYSAYFALSFSSILWVRTPRVCVIKDFYRDLKNENVDFICKDEEGNSIIEKRVMDLELNCADGQGIIDPYFAQLWAEDMNLSYIPCSFVARSCFVKGNLVTFDFKEYAHQHDIFTIKDKWGNEYNIDDIDVLLSESQFKTHKYYSSWEEYQQFAQEANIHWGVARYNKKQDEECVLANYQYIQALNLSQEDIKGLIQPTIDWIKQVCKGELLSTMLYAFGSKSDTIDYASLYGSAQTTAMKALIKNPDFLQDTYIQRKIYKNITESINHAKIGKIWIRGNYQFMIADPLAQVQAAIGLEPTGLLKRDEIYSDFWSKRKTQNCVIDCARSPMIDVHEHNPMTVVVDNEDANYWYKYINSGIIYNTYDTSCFRHEDSDYDGDICLTTDNEYFIKGSHKDHNIITYEKGLATPAKMTIPNITATVIKGFGTGVGGFSNTATILYSMAAIFNKPGHEDQYNTIMTRIKLLREIVGQEIDRIKGADKPSLPRAWKKFEQINEDDSPEEKTRKIKANAIVISKKPYFFRYLYPELNQKFKQFESSYNQISKDMFGMKFKKLLKKENKTDEEKMLVRRYQKYCPLITSPCTMNNLCREFESVDFDIRFAKDENDVKLPTVSMLPTFEDKFADAFDQQKYQIVKDMYQEYVSKKQIKHLTALLQNSADASLPDDYKEIRSTLYDLLISGLQLKLADSNIAGDEFLFYSYRLSKVHKSFNWGFVWSILDDQILKFIPKGHIVYPVRDPEGTYEYLGETYSLKDLDAIPESRQDLLLATLTGENSQENYISSYEQEEELLGNSSPIMTQEEIESIISKMGYMDDDILTTKEEN